MPPIISLISCRQAVIRLTSRSQPTSGFSRLTSSGLWVAMPQLHLPVWQVRQRWQPSASSAAVADVAGVRAQRDGLDHVCGAADAAAHHQRNVVADALVAQPLVHRRQRQLDGDAHIVADAGGRGARAAAEAVDGDDVRAAAGDAAGDGRNVMYGRHLDDDRLLVFGGLLERIDELPQVLDGIDVVVRGGGDGVRRPRGSCACGETSPTIFAPGRWPPMPGLAPWPILISIAAPAFRYASWTPKRPEATCTMVFAPYW